MQKRIFVKAWILILMFFLSVHAITNKLHADEWSRSAMSVNRQAFSPNDDGSGDTVTIILNNAPKKKLIQKWSVEIKDDSGKIVKTFIEDRRWLRSSLLLVPTSDVKPIALWSSLVWDGRDDKGLKLSDGTYTIIGIIYPSERSFPVVLNRLQVRIDTVAPKLTLIPEATFIFRKMLPKNELAPPSGTIKLRQLSSKTANMKFKGEILDVAGEVIENSSREWNNTLLPVVRWNGYRHDYKPADPGTYRYKLSAIDDAGNQASIEYSSLLVSGMETPPIIDPLPETSSFSPNVYESSRHVKIQVCNPEDGRAINVMRGVDSYALSIYNEDKKSIAALLKGNGFPSNISWDGKSGLLGNTNTPLQDGLYYLKLVLHDGLKIIESDFRPLRIDTRGPSISLSVDSNYLSPDGDGEDEFSKIKLNAVDVSDIDRWSLDIRYATRTKTPLYLPHKTFAGISFVPNVISWDGRGDDGTYPESLEYFEVRLTVKDRAGNFSRSTPAIIQSDVLFRPINDTSSDLLASVPDQKYLEDIKIPQEKRLVDERIKKDSTGPGKIFYEQKLTSSGESAVKRIYYKLKLYPYYKVRIEYHTQQAGREEDNLAESEQAALAIYNYLVKLGFPNERLIYSGRGETEPLTSLKTPFYEYRNCRIQIRLFPSKTIGSSPNPTK